MTEGRSMNVPERTTAQRANDLRAATEARHQRAMLKGRIKAGEVSFKDVIDGADDPIMGRMRVCDLIGSIPGIGEQKTTRIMNDLGIAMSRRVQGLSDRQREALLERFGA